MSDNDRATSDNGLDLERLAIVENEIKHLIANYDELAIKIETVSIDLENKIAEGFERAEATQAAMQKSVDRLLGYFQMGKGAWAIIALLFGATIATAGSEIWQGLSRPFRQ